MSGLGDSTAPASDVLPVTPSDTVDLAKPSRAIRAVGAGNIAMITAGSGGATRTVTFADGETRYIRATRILSTGTTASGIDIMV
jgi:hypothetical protein